jgi:hypothetical protein
MGREPWYESPNPSRVARGGSWRIGVWIICAVVFFALLGGAIWGIKVLVSGPKGAGDQEIITNDGRNRINAQEWFQSQYGQILTADRQLDDAAANLAKNPTGDFEKTNYTGLKNRCVDMVNAYNAEANKVTRGKWMSPDLPEHIDDSDPKTDCKETVK